MRDLVTHGLNRLAYQFKDSEKLKSLISVQLQEFGTLDNIFDNLLNDRFIDTAIGAQLDGLGEILGLPRPFLPVDVIGAFGFFSDPTSKSFGDITDPNLGGYFVDFAATRQIANDEAYRKLLRAKAVINGTSTTVGETINMVSLMFDGARVRYTLPINLSPTYTIGKVLDATEIGLIGLLPKLLGIDNVSYISVDTFDAFGFLNDPDAKGFTDLNNTDLGGSLASIVT